MENSPLVINHRVQSEIEQLKHILTSYSSQCVFEDDIWFMDIALKNQKLPKFAKSIYFSKVPVEYVRLVKEFALIRLSFNTSVRTVKSNVDGLLQFFSFLSDTVNGLRLGKVNKKVIYEYQEYLENSSFSQRTKETIWTAISSFFNLMTGYREVPTISFAKNPFSNHSRKPRASKYIDQFIIQQLDNIFKNEEIPLAYKTAYWICRLIPSRISEVCSMKIDCIKPYINETVITIPMFKQNGGHGVPELRQIALKEEGMGKFLIDLIREQMEASKSLQSHIHAEEDTNFLFTHQV